jgi:hypothetical protein
MTLFTMGWPVCDSEKLVVKYVTYEGLDAKNAQRHLQPHQQRIMHSYKPHNDEQLLLNTAASCTPDFTQRTAIHCMVCAMSKDSWVVCRCSTCGY